jgi:hypothetical protein
VYGETQVALETNEWQELYEGAREVFGPTRAAIFMRTMERGARDDWATRADLSDLRASLERELRGQTWRLAGLVVAASGLVFAVARIA